MNNDTTLFIGLDTHKSFTQVALLKDNRGETPISYGRIDTSKSALIKLAKKIQYEIDDLDPESKQELASLESRLDKPVVGGVAFRGDDEDGLRDMSLTHSCSGEFGIAFKKILLNHK